MFALYPMLGSAVQRFAAPRNLLVVAILACAGAIIAFGIAFVEVKVLNFNQGRATGYATNPIPSSTAALLLGFFALAGLFAVSRPWRYLFLLGPIAGIGTVYLSGSRGPLLALPALLIIAVVILPIRRAITLSIASIGVVGAVAVFVFRPTLLGRIAVLPAMLGDLLSGRPIATNLDVGGSIRYSILQGSIGAFEHAPWLGYGWYMKVPAVEIYLPWDVHFGDATHAHLHSDILNFAVSAGVVGLVAYALVLLAPIVSAARSARDTQYRGRLYLGLTLSAGFACCGAVNLLFGFEYMTTLYVVFAALFVGFCRDARPGAVA
jgi:O-antigen ligase